MADTRHVHLDSSLGSELLLQRMRGSEELGRPFKYRLELLSLDPMLKIEDLLGDKMTVVLTLPDGERFFNGHVSRFGQGEKLGRYTRYHATLRPFFWLLTRASDSRIFKKASVVDIIKKVISQFGIGQVEDSKLQGTYLEREYTVQYRESYFDFLSRLMEEEGIYYFFRHEKSQHVMVLGDDKGSHKVVPNYAKIPFIDPEENAHPREEHFSEWTHMQEVETGAFVVNDYDFETPKADLIAKLARPLKHKHASLEQYDPLAGYVDALDAGGGGDTKKGDRGSQFARVRLEELQAEHDRSSAVGNARGPFAGALFELTGHPRDDQNHEVLVVSADYRVYQPGFDAGSSAGGKDKKGKDDEEEESVFEVELEVQPSKLPFRPRRITDRPVIAGPHTGLVVGSGEINTDIFGRIKVHFPWDREDADGCWLRVSQAWAGGGWGAVHIPRVGQEVIVEFVEGDPDRPIVTGRVYNGTNTPPFGLPDGATNSGILSRSTKGGSADTANEFRLEDKKGEEQLFLHAEKNMDTEVEKDQTTWVGQDRKKVVDRDQTEDVKGNKTIHVIKNHKETIDETMTLTVGGDETEKIGGDRAITVSGDHSEKIEGNQGMGVAKSATWTAGGDGTINFDGAGKFDVGKSLSQSVGKDWTCGVEDNTSLSTGKDLGVSSTKNTTIGVGEAMKLTVGKDWASTVEGAAKLTVTKEYTVKAKEVLIEATGKKITLKAGDASITLSDGNIEIKGSKISVKSDGDVIMKGSKVAQN